MVLSDKSESGFTLIEILITLVITSILAAVAIPGFLGVQDRARRNSLILGSEAATSDLKNWIMSANRGSARREIDTSGDGQIKADDKTNLELSGFYGTANALCAEYIKLRSSMSPWDSTKLLWIADAAETGRISCTHAANGNILLEAQDNRGAVIYAATITVE